MGMRGGSEGESCRFSHCLDRWTETAKSGAVGMRGRQEEKERKRRANTHLNNELCFILIRLTHTCTFKYLMLQIMVALPPLQSHFTSLKSPRHTHTQRANMKTHCCGGGKRALLHACLHCATLLSAEHARVEMKVDNTHTQVVDNMHLQLQTMEEHRAVTLAALCRYWY